VTVGVKILAERPRRTEQMKIPSLVISAVVGVVLTISPASYAQQTLANQDIVKLVKAGLAEDVVLNMIGSQPTQFSLTADDVIALKADGVSDKIISAMVSKSQSRIPPTAAQQTSTSGAQTITGPDRPNDTQILAAIRSDPNRNNPQSLTALVMSTRPLGSTQTALGTVTRLGNIDITVTGFRLIQWGDFNSAGKYWPVELCVNGTADDKKLELFSRSERVTAGAPNQEAFNTRARYRLYKDDFGGLKAEQILVSEWKPQDSICPRTSGGGVSAKRDPSEVLIEESTRGDQDSSGFPVQTSMVNSTFDTLWNKINGILAKNDDKVERVDKDKGLIVTALTKHGSFPVARYDKYCIVLEKVTENTTKIFLKALLYSPTIGSDRKVARPQNRVADQARKLLDQFAK
jgi:hypothetical protein